MRPYNRKGGRLTAAKRKSMANRVEHMVAVLDGFTAAFDVHTGDPKRGEMTYQANQASKALRQLVADLRRPGMREPS